MRRFLLSVLFPSLTLGACLAACRPAPATVDDPGPRWHATRVALIGGDTGRNSFASVRSLLFSAHGELYVVDEQDHVVKVFDSTGAFLRQLGRVGAGPGEYADPYSLAWLHDTLALLDPGNSRIGLFAPDGHWRSLPVQPISGGSDVRLYRGTDTTFWVYGYHVVDRKPQSVFIRYTGAGPRDTIPFYRSGAPDFTITCETADKGLHFFSSPFAPADLLLPSPSGARQFARTDRYRIVTLGVAGDTTGTLARDEVQPAIRDSEWEAGLTEWREFRAQAASPKCDGGDLTRPSGKPVLAALFFGPEGHLWVEVHAATGVRYDLWDPQGHPAGRVDGLPTSAEVDPAFFGDLVALPVTGAGDAPGVGIFRLTRVP